MQSIGIEQGQDETLRKISSEELLWRSGVLEDVKRINPKPYGIYISSRREGLWPSAHTNHRCLMLPRRLDINLHDRCISLSAQGIARSSYSAPLSEHSKSYYYLRRSKLLIRKAKARIPYIYNKIFWFDGSNRLAFQSTNTPYYTYFFLLQLLQNTTKLFRNSAS